MSDEESTVYANAEAMFQNCTAFLEAKRDTCSIVTQILISHPENTVPSPEDHEIGEMHYSQTLEELDNMNCEDAEKALLLPEESRKKACSSPSKSPSKHEDRTTRKINTFLRKQYKKTIKTVGSKWEQIFPRKIDDTKDQIFYMLTGMKEMEFDLKNLENALKSLQEALEQPGVTPHLLQRKMKSVDLFVSNANEMYEVTVDYMLSYNKKLKKYIKYRLPGGKYATVQLPRRSERLAQASANAPEDPQQPSTSKRMAKQADKESPEKTSEMLETQPPVETTAGYMVQKATYADRDMDCFEGSSDSAGEASQDTISTHVYDSVEDIALSESEGDGAEKSRSKSVVKKVGTTTTGTKSKPRAEEGITEPKDNVAKKTGAKPKSKRDDTTTGTKPKIKRDDTKTGAKPKKVNVKKTPTKSKYGYSRVNPTDSEED